jgi:prepilin-type processing-associated H-X9-DG protein
MPSTDLYLAVMPLVHVKTGLAEETLTLFPDKNFASEFFPEQVDDYINLFQLRANMYFVGGHVTGYEFHKEPTMDGRVIVRVTQNVR